MKSYQLTVRVVIDETNINAPSLDDLKLAVEESVNTIDNSIYGIHSLSVSGEEVENFNSENLMVDRNE